MSFAILPLLAAALRVVSPTPAPNARPKPAAIRDARRTRALRVKRSEFQERSTIENMGQEFEASVIIIATMAPES